MMLGFGVRLDSSWQVLGWLLLSAGGLVGGVGLLALGRARGDAEAFVPGDGRG